MAFRVTVLLLLVLIAWSLWAVRQLGSVWKKPPAPLEEPVQKEPVPEPIPVPVPVSVEQKAVPPPTDLRTEKQRLVFLDARVKGCLVRQKKIPLPQPGVTFKTRKGRIFKNVSIIRLEPDGIHVRHSAGLVKIECDELPDDLKAQYGIEAEVALRYHQVIAERSRDAQQTVSASREEERAVNTERIEKAKAVALDSAVTESKDLPSSRLPGTVRCDVCKRWVPKESTRIYSCRISPASIQMGHSTVCPDCYPKNTRNDG